MNEREAVEMLMARFPILRLRSSSESDLFEMPHVTFGLLATEILENQDSVWLLPYAGQFCNELAESEDDILEEHLVVDVLEGVAQNIEVSNKLKTYLRPKALGMLERVEREFFKRDEMQSQ
jgi:hypothetical protein